MLQYNNTVPTLALNFLRTCMLKQILKKYVCVCALSVHCVFSDSSGTAYVYYDDDVGWAIYFSSIKEAAHKLTISFWNYPHVLQ